jgi:ferritin
MIAKNVEKAIIEQIRREEESSRIYLAMASWCEANGYPGAANWFSQQVEEERMHQSKFIHYLNDRGGHAVLSELDKPVATFKSLLDLFERTLKHEQFISQSINDLYSITMKEKDYPTGNFLQWFITEQIEEESTVRNILDKLRLIGSEKVGLYEIDRELGRRIPAKPAGGTANT